jgi:endo-1,4-beta-D-glucanase Y
LRPAARIAFPFASRGFGQLFHGDPSTEAIYFTTGADQAYILDIFHGDVRSEGLGFGMMIAVELGKRDEFDRLWRYTKASQYGTGRNPWAVDESNRLLQFFARQGIDTYAGGYTLDGKTVVDSNHQSSLVAASGVLALIATIDQRTQFIDAVWNLDPPTGEARYYSGLLRMLAQLVLSGQMAVF